MLTRTRRRLIFSGLAAGLAFLIQCTTSTNVPPTQVLPQPLAVKIDTVEYIQATDNFLVKWTPPVAQEGIIGYNLYQEWNDTSNGNAFAIPRNDTIIAGWLTGQYLDFPGPGIGTYYYKISALAHRQNLNGINDTIEGAKSAAAKVIISIPPNGILLINGGASHTASDSVSLTLIPLSQFTPAPAISPIPAVGPAVLTDGGITDIQYLATGTDSTPFATVRLPKGGGTKTVSVLVHRKTASGIDTNYVLSNFIKIQRSKIKITIKNEDQDKVTSKYFKQLSPWGGFLTLQKNIQFQISAFGDSTFSPVCSVWVVVSGNGNFQLPDTIANLSNAWLETTPKEYIVDFSKEPLLEYDLEDSANMRTFVYTSSKDQKPRRAGGYLGGVDTVGFGNGPYYDPSSIYYLFPADLYAAGYKEFYIAAKFKGRFFGEDRFFYSKQNSSTKRWWDFYPPKIRFGKGDTPQESDTVSGPFNVRLQTGLKPLWDAAWARPTEIKLFFTKTSRTTGSGAGLEELFSGRYIVYDFPFVSTTYYSTNIGWVDIINPALAGAEWESGNYLMAIVTADNLGNRGIAPSDPENPTEKNPRVFYIKSGK